MAQLKQIATGLNELASLNWKLAANTNKLPKSHILKIILHNFSFLLTKKPDSIQLNEYFFRL